MPDANTPVWGVREIARIIGRTERQTYHLLGQGHLDASRVGGRWVSTRRRLLKRIADHDGFGDLRSLDTSELKALNLAAG
jgi:hypothetical protein